VNRRDMIAGMVLGSSASTFAALNVESAVGPLDAATLQQTKVAAITATIKKWKPLFKDDDRERIYAWAQEWLKSPESASPPLQLKAFQG
jgi:hypothetical protein